MRILVAVAPKMYRETLAHILRRDRPDDDVRLADPHSLDREATSFGPHLILRDADKTARFRAGLEEYRNGTFLIHHLKKKLAPLL